jgi:hypothetical protein
MNYGSGKFESIPKGDIIPILGNKIIRLKLMIITFENMYNTKMINVFIKLTTQNEIIISLYNDKYYPD